MAKHPIEWHESNIINMRSTLVGEMFRLNRIQKNIDRLTREIDKYQNQIKLATSEGKTEFDDERYGIQKIKLSKLITE